MAEPGRGDPHTTESDESGDLEDNSLGRLLTLSDGVFAIAMTLLALDLKVPQLGAHVRSGSLRHALGHEGDTYLSFLVSFYVIANYWQRHRLLMRSVVTTHPRLIRDTITLLLVIAAMPFPASLLGQDGGTPFALSLYGLWNLLAVLALLRLQWDVRQFELLGHQVGVPRSFSLNWETLRSLVVFLLCLPAGYVLGSSGPWVLVLLAVPTPLPLLRNRRRRRARRKAGRTRKVADGRV